MAEYEAKYDLNNDGKIDQTEVDLLVSVYGARHDSSALAQACDFTGTGLVVDSTDFNMLAQSIGAVKEITRYESGGLPSSTVGGTPDSVGYSWNTEQGGWLRFDGSFVPRSSVPEWDKYIPVTAQAGIPGGVIAVLILLGLVIFSGGQK